MTSFLKANDFALTVDVEEEIAMVLRAAASEIGEEEWTAWVVGRVTPL